jgi:hypothetical protein
MQGKSKSHQMADEQRRIREESSTTKATQWQEFPRPLITLNVNTLNSPIKRHTLVNWIKKQDPTCWGPGMNPGPGNNGACKASPTIYFPAPGVLTFVLTSP